MEIIGLGGKMIKLINSNNDVTLVEDTSILAKIMRSMSKLTAIEIGTQSGMIKPYLSKQEAYKVAGGRRRVDKWIECGDLVNHGDEGGSFRISRSELESLMEASDLIATQIDMENERIRKKRITKYGKKSA